MKHKCTDEEETLIFLWKNYNKSPDVVVITTQDVLNLVKKETYQWICITSVSPQRIYVVS